MTEFKLESGIAIPLKDIRANNKYPLGRMEVGQSFFVPPEKGDTPELLMNRMRNAIFRASKAGKGSYVIRRWENGIRCWRTK